MNKGALAVILAATLWGVDGVVLRPALYSLDVKVIVFLEHLIAFSLMAIPLFLERKALKKLVIKDWLAFFWIALFGGALGTMAITKALFLVDFNHISVILILQKLQPLFAILLAWILLKERPKKTFFFWAVMAIVGSYLITYGFEVPSVQGNSILIAALLSLAAAFSFGSSTVFGKFTVSRVSFRIATYLRFGLTTLVMFFFVAASGFSGISDIEGTHILRLILIAVTTGGLAIIIYYYGLKKVPASKATIYELAFPVTAVLLPYLISGALLSIGQFIGALLIIISMMMITK